MTGFYNRGGKCLLRGTSSLQQTLFSLLMAFFTWKGIHHFVVASPFPAVLQNEIAILI